MERRKFIIGAGALGAGISTAIGTGAFTSVEAERSFSVATAGDAEAYLRMTAADSPNAQYVDEQSDTLSVTLDSLNENAVTTVDDLFLLQNEGTQAISVYLTDSSDAVTFEADGSSVEGVDGAVRLGVGESVTVDIEVDTTDASGTLLDSVTVMAKSQVFAAGDDGVVTVGPNGTAADYSSVQAGVDAAADADASAVLVDTGAYSESVTVEQADLTLQAAEGASPVLTSPDGESTVTVAADGVTVEGLTVENPQGQKGVALESSASAVTIVDNVVSNVGTGDDASGYTEALSVIGGNTGIDVVDNEFSDIRSKKDGGAYTAKAIWMTANQSSTPSESDPITDVTIRGNVISNVTSDVAAYGIQLQADISGVEVVDNHISGVTGDLDGETDWAAAINLSKGEGEFAGPSDIDVVGNYLSAQSSTTNDSYPGTALVVEGNTAASTIEAHENDFEAPSGAVNKTGNGEVDATNNWWGSVSGPTKVTKGSAPGQGSDAATIVNWTGDGVAVDYSDYATEPFFSETHTVAADGSGDFEAIEAAISAAQPTDTIAVTGEYTLDNVDITTPHLTVTAADTGATIRVPETSDTNTQDRAFSLEAEGITVSDFSFVAESDISNPNEINVAADNATVLNNDFTRAIDAGTDLTAYSTIHVDHEGVTGVTIKDNTVEKGAIGAGGSGQTTVINNTVIDSGVEGIYAVVNGDEEYIIKNNDVTGFDGLGDGAQAVKLTALPSSVNGTNSTSLDAVAAAVFAENEDVPSIRVAGEIFTP
ncbi:right-handed parallel beta-helix repeat-containing protein [Halosegnis longus]